MNARQARNDLRRNYIARSRRDYRKAASDAPVVEASMTLTLRAQVTS